MTLEQVVVLSQWVFLTYFILITLGYLFLNLVATVALFRFMPGRRMDRLGVIPTNLEPPISVLVPAYNEATTISATVYSLLQLQYPKFEVLVINDGSKDDTIEVLKEEFSLQPFPHVPRTELQTAQVREVYRSTTTPKLKVIDKENGGKADSLNAGINAARYPLVCGIDADSILQRDSLLQVVRPFLEDVRTVACGGTVRLANGCEVRQGFLIKPELPDNWLALVQVTEYLRAFLFGRMGWSPLNALLIISGAFGLFHRDTVIKAGGYRPNTIGEDMELVVRMHHMLRKERTPYRISFVPDPVCWTEAPEDLRTLKNQRVRWQQGLCESLFPHLGLMFSLRGGAVGWFAFPFMLIFECFGPMIEVAGYAFIVLAFITGVISTKAFFVFLILVVCLGMLLSVTALYLEEVYFHVYRKPGHMLRLFIAALVENFGYRQLNSIWRLWGLLKHFSGAKSKWGEMKRKGDWTARAED